MRCGRVGGVVAPCGFWYGAGPMSTAFSMIADSAALRTLVDRLQEEAVLAFDTEFTWERTYYARLGLVQLAAADGRCFLIDPLAVGDLAPLGELLANARIVKILHDALQDLMILRRATGVAARNVFDTRLAAGFAGLASTLSLGNLLAETVCKAFHIPDPIPKGVGIGTSAHAVGTSKALQMGEVEGAMSGLSIAVAGVLTAVLCPVFVNLID